MIGGAKLHLESNPMPARDAQRAQTSLVCTRTQRPRLRQTCVWASLVEVRVSSGLPQGQGLWMQQIWVWHKPSWRRLPLTPPQTLQNLHRTGKQTLGGQKQNLCTPGPERKEQWPHKRLTQTCLWVSRGLQWRNGSVVVCCRVWGTDFFFFPYF